MRHRPLRAVAGLSESGLLDGRADLLIVGEGGGRPMAMPIPIAPLRIIPSRNGSQIVSTVASGTTISPAVWSIAACESADPS